MKEVEIQEAGSAIQKNVLNLEPNISNNQRIFSVVAGSLLLFDSIVRKGSLTRSLAAGYLLFRGATGYCAITDVSENAVPKAKNALENARNKAGEAYDNVLEQAQESYEKYSGQAKDAVEDYKNKAKNTAEEYTNKAKDAVSDYKNQAKDAVNGATDKVKEMADKVMHLNSAGEKYDINIETQIRVHSSRQEVYDYWRKLENLPNFMEHLESVKQLDKTTSEWKAKVPGGVATIDWKAEIVEDKRLGRISWKSVEGADVENAGTVDFFDAGKQGTDVHVVISYHAPAGKVGSAIAKLLNPTFETLIENDIKRFAEVMEEGKAELERAGSNGKQTK